MVNSLNNDTDLENTNLVQIIGKERFDFLFPDLPTDIDPIIPAGDPFGVVSPQSYADKRITSTVVKFNDFDYKSNFELGPNDIAIMNETFKYKKNGNVRKNEHKLYMPTQTKILSLAKETGFILLSQIDMLRCFL